MFASYYSCIFLKSVKAKAPISPKLICRMWGSTSVLLFRHVLKSSCSENSKNLLNMSALHSWQQHSSELVKLGIRYLGNGPLKITSCCHRPRFQQKQFMLRDVTYQNHKSSLMPASTRQPRSMIIYQDDKNHNPVKQMCALAFPSIHCVEESQAGSAKDTESPMLFSLESNNYYQALSTIAAARDSGNLCHPAAARLRDLCHLMHMESVIRAAAKPCNDSADDIIIRKEDREPTECDIPHFTIDERKGEGCLPLPKDFETRTCTSSPNNQQAVPFNIFGSYLQTLKPTPSNQDLPFVHSSDNGMFVCIDRASHTQSYREEEVQPPDQTPSDGPSREQIAYIHLRLSEEMPRFFEQSPDYGLYADNILFDNRIMKVRTRGLPAYKATVQSLKYLSTAYLMKTQMEVLRITMETEQCYIQARWRIKGVPVHSYILRPWGKRRKYRYYDAFSTFHVGTDGLIHTHVLDKVIPSSDTKVQISSWAVRLGVALGLVRPPAFDPDVMKATPLMKSLLGK